MILLKNFCENSLKYDLLNKFTFDSMETLPRIEKIILSLNFKCFDINLLLSGLIAIELVASQKIIFLRSRYSNVIFKVRKGNPIGCKVTLRKINMYNFFFYLIVNNLSKPPLFNKYNKTLKFYNKDFSFVIKNVFKLSELEDHYNYFKHLPELNVVLVFNFKIPEKNLFLLKSTEMLFK